MAWNTKVNRPKRSSTEKEPWNGKMAILTKENMQKVNARDTAHTHLWTERNTRGNGPKISSMETACIILRTITNMRGRGLAILNRDKVLRTIITETPIKVTGQKISDKVMEPINMLTASCTKENGIMIRKRDADGLIGGMACGMTERGKKINAVGKECLTILTVIDTLANGRSTHSMAKAHISPTMGTLTRADTHRENALARERLNMLMGINT